MPWWDCNIDTSLSILKLSLVISYSSTKRAKVASFPLDWISLQQRNTCRTLVARLYGSAHAHAQQRQNLKWQTLQKHLLTRSIVHLLFISWLNVLLLLCVCVDLSGWLLRGGLIFIFWFCCLNIYVKTSVKYQIRFYLKPIVQQHGMHTSDNQIAIEADNRVERHIQNR